MKLMVRCNCHPVTYFEVFVIILIYLLGKVFELNGGMSRKNTNSVIRNQNDSVASTMTTQQKSLEYAIEDQVFSVAKINAKPFEEACSVSQTDRNNLEATLENLQVYHCLFYYTALLI